jgi:serine phosphatase RsbU (regulator of sigma subunit)/Tfp pilus assembly protein PilF
MMVSEEYVHGQPGMAIRHVEDAMDWARQLADSALMAACYNRMGAVMKRLGDYTNAQQFYFQALTLYEHAGYDRGVLAVCNNIGRLYAAQANLPQAMSYYGRALALLQDDDSRALRAALYHNVGEAYSAQAQYTEALTFLNRSLALLDERRQGEDVAAVQANIAEVYARLGQPQKAAELYRRATSLLPDSLPRYGMAERYIQFGLFRAQEGHFDEANRLLRQGLQVAQRIQEQDAVMQAFQALAQVAEKAGQPEQALAYYHRYMALKDSIFSLQRSMLIADTRVKYEVEKREREYAWLEKEHQVREGQLRIRNVQTAIAMFSLLALFGVAAVLYRGKQRQQRVNRILHEQQVLMEQKREEIASQKEDIEEKNAALEGANRTLALKNERITDSLVYGKSVQESVLPSLAQLRSHFHDAFVLFQPKDLVSGDFYWLAKLRNRVFFAVADCTGHGVPGAFMSLLGHAYLHEIIMVRGMASTATILDALHETIVAALHQREGMNQDGMTIALCSFEHQPDGSVRMSFSGAKMDVLCHCAQEDQWRTFSGDRHNIGGIARDLAPRRFTRTSHLLYPGDQVYFFTDGFPDQANPKFRRFGSKRLVELLQTHADKPLQEQCELLHKALRQYQGSMEQRDDVTVAGLCIGLPNLADDEKQAGA